MPLLLFSVPAEHAREACILPDPKKGGIDAPRTQPARAPPHASPASSTSTNSSPAATIS